MKEFLCVERKWGSQGQEIDCHWTGTFNKIWSVAYDSSNCEGCHRSWYGISSVSERDSKSLEHYELIDYAFDAERTYFLIFEEVHSNNTFVAKCTDIQKILAVHKGDFNKLYMYEYWNGDIVHSDAEIFYLVKDS